MEPTSLTTKEEYERYLELSRMLGTQTMSIIEQVSSAELEAQLVGRDPEKAALVREAHAIFWKDKDSDASDITGHPV